MPKFETHKDEIIEFSNGCKFHFIQTQSDELKGMSDSPLFIAPQEENKTTEQLIQNLDE